ncbi:hypothetical protein PIB30_015307 [Stylosanthes scabra]|uniref:Uncharacterized protein n=1 Tax=Stylosanthes scabra TaxID=79078 RepID=A0ABU6Z3T9_9FABA|nr:hypothetical protein [Stylosanthes scabra]
MQQRVRQIDNPHKTPAVEFFGLVGIEWVPTFASMVLAVYTNGRRDGLYDLVDSPNYASSADLWRNGSGRYLIHCLFSSYFTIRRSSFAGPRREGE